jgi:hypothetical protein
MTSLNVLSTSLDEHIKDGAGKVTALCAKLRPRLHTRQSTSTVHLLRHSLPSALRPPPSALRPPVTPLFLSHASFPSLSSSDPTSRPRSTRSRSGCKSYNEAVLAAEFDINGDDGNEPPLRISPRTRQQKADLDNIDDEEDDSEDGASFSQELELELSSFGASGGGGGSRCSSDASDPSSSDDEMSEKKAYGNTGGIRKVGRETKGERDGGVRCVNMSMFL